MSGTSVSVSGSPGRTTGIPSGGTFHTGAVLKDKQLQQKNERELFLGLLAGGSPNPLALQIILICAAAVLALFYNSPGLQQVRRRRRRDRVLEDEEIC